MDFIERQFVYMMVMEEASRRLKIGYSNNPVRRCKELYTSGVPHPFHILHVWEVVDMFAVEKLIHVELADFRPNGRREFFEVFGRYGDHVDYSFPDVINGLVVSNQLASDIDVKLRGMRVEFRRWYLNDLENYDVAMRAWQKKRKEA